MTSIHTFIPTESWPDILTNLNSNFDNINDDLIQAEADIVALQWTLPIADASTTVKWPTKLSVAPVSAVNPIAVGDNDPRVPTQWENDALVGTNGTPSASNKFVTASDTNLTNNVKTTWDQTIAWIKTFSSIPLLPASDPTTANQAVRKAYADSVIAETTGTTVDWDMTISWKKRWNKFYYNVWGSYLGADYTLLADAGTLARLATLFWTLSTSTKYSGLDWSGTTTYNIYNGSTWTQTTWLWENNMLTSFTIV